MGDRPWPGYLGLKNHSVNLFDRNPDKVKVLSSKGGIHLEGKIKGFGKSTVLPMNCRKRWKKLM